VTSVRVLVVIVVVVFAALVVSVLVDRVDLWRLWSLIGDEEFYMAASLVLFYLYPSPGSALTVLLSVVLSGSVNVSLKYWLCTPRPPDPLVVVEGYGFPSGHAQVSTSFWFTTSWIRRDYALLFLSVVVVAGVSLSRLYLRAHYPVDVIGGVLIGFFISLGVYLSVRITGYLAAVVLAATSLVLSTAAYMLLGAPSDSCSVLAATALSLLVVYWVFARRGFKIWNLGLRARVFFLLTSLLVVYTAHSVTRGLVFPARFLAVFSGVLLALCLPLLSSGARRAGY
jgi:membrane-associated phospholipid phosphatase